MFQSLVFPQGMVCVANICLSVRPAVGGGCGDTKRKLFKLLGCTYVSA